nr:regulator of G-protein signaling 14 [Camelus dromedarius]
MPGKPKHLGVPNGRMVLAVSDGELSSTAGPQGQGEGRGSSLSIHSLPSGPSSPFPSEEQPVASWGLSFERLLQDPLGLAYFTEIFLREEFMRRTDFLEGLRSLSSRSPASDTQAAQGPATTRGEEGSRRERGGREFGKVENTGPAARKSMNIEMQITVYPHFPRWFRSPRENPRSLKTAPSAELAALERVADLSPSPTKELQERPCSPYLANEARPEPTTVALHRPGEKQPLDLGKLVSSVAAQRLVLDTLPGVKIPEAGDTPPCRSQGGQPRIQDKAADHPSLPLNSLAQAPSSITGKRQTCDIEGLVELLNRVQSSGAHDQRGLLRKEDLVLPEFLQLPAQGPNSQEASSQTESAPQPKGGPSDSSVHSAL